MNSVKELRDKMVILNKELTSEQKRSENFEIEANKVKTEDYVDIIAVLRIRIILDPDPRIHFRE